MPKIFGIRSERHHWQVLTQKQNKNLTKRERRADQIGQVQGEYRAEHVTETRFQAGLQIRIRIHLSG
jgi:hypothetical protein